ncbi:hypothetical protein P389DRAFT_47160 [Cystobasidium minutum MCA 4210]|uniref:uncharacterized protein n=1 Tax=Cystobasidium minutum MCA 4210 TaxID=1397322 RepID=UPI0034CF5280|eukprot:jgi/Rhomi1/47160/CE47159_1971
MAPERTSKNKRAGDTSVHKYSKAGKKIKPELTKEEKLQKKWKSLKDQVEGGFLENAYKTSKRILELDPENHSAIQTHIQILLSLDRYKDALSFILSQQQSSTSSQWQLEQAYALYKLGKVPDAAVIVDAIRADSMQLDEEAEYARAVDVLDAQVKYRLEQFDQAQVLYEDLLATLEAETPEQADLTANLEACNAHIDFIKSVPSRLAEMSSQHAENRIPSVDDLETTPIFPLIAAHPAYKTRTAAATTATAAAASTAEASTSSTTRPTGTAAVKSKAKSSKKSKAAAEKKGDTKKKFVKLPPSIASLPENQRPAPDPERWLPKRERKGYAEILAAKEREKEKKRLKARKKLEATLTQGAASSAGATEESSAKQTQSGAGGGGKSKNKKKKGGR